MSEIDLVTPYHDYFQLIPANTEELKKEVYRIRYDVYCRELGWEDADDNPGEMEIDQYDQWSHHCLLLHKPSQRFAGCVRLVRAVPEKNRPGIPLQAHCHNALDPEILDIDALPRHSFGEISRLAIRAEFRRRPGEKENPGGTGNKPPSLHPSQRRRFPHIALGLYLGAASIGLAEGLEGVFAMMEPRLARHLRLTGIRFQQVGKILEYHGPRAPFYINRTGLFANLRPELLKLLRAIEKDLGLPPSMAQHRIRSQIN
jgi:N-acyl amino acid synthase of PEP-CTERM/exosortase system